MRKLDAFRYVPEWTGRHLDVAHLDGVPWHQAPAPPLLHRHWPQTTSTAAHRCACGALRVPTDGAPWLPELLRARRVGGWFRFLAGRGRR